MGITISTSTCSLEILAHACDFTKSSWLNTEEVSPSAGVHNRNNNTEPHLSGVFSLIATDE